MLNLLPWKEGGKLATGFENLKNSDPSSLVHDGVVNTHQGYVIVIPLSLPALTIGFDIQIFYVNVNSHLFPPLSSGPSFCTSYAIPAQRQ